MNLQKLLLLIFCFQLSVLFSQDKQEAIEQIIKLKNINIKHKKRIDIETAKLKEFLNLAFANTQSAKMIINNISEGSSSEDTEKDYAALLFEKAGIYSKKADSVAKITSQLQDSVKYNIGIIYNLAQNIRLSPADTIIDADLKKEYLKTLSRERAKPLTGAAKEKPKSDIETPTTPSKQILMDKKYTVQIRADKEGGYLLKGLDNLRVIKFDDGYYRYFIGEYDSYNDALKAQKKLIEKGFKDCFIKTLNK